MTYEDQVPRLLRFAQDHPEVKILSPYDSGHAYWKAFRDGEQLAVELDLKYLLDKLEKELP